MKFTFNGTLGELTTRMQNYEETLSKDIYVRQTEPNHMEIGFLSHGRKGGRYFVATVTESDGQTILDGTIANKPTPLPKRRKKSTLKMLCSTLSVLLLCYVIFGALPWILWWALRIPHPWISFVLPALPILSFFLPNPRKFFKEDRNYDYEDEDFCLFMDTVCGKGHPVPTTSQELYQILAETPGLHSLPKFENDTLIWELYDKATVEASIIKNSTIIELLGNNFFRTAYTHWHPNPEAIYGELRELGKKGHILVLRKTLLGTETYYYGDPNGYTLPKKKKWHWGRLIYLEQR